MHEAPCQNTEPTLADKVAFLARADTHGVVPGAVSCRETHMSWVFLVGDRVYKLKKPVRFPYLDFSTPGRRETACRAELRLNRRLAPDVYLDVVPLTIDGRGLSIGGPGAVVDWLVLMKRLDERLMLDHLIEGGELRGAQLDRLSRRLAHFYRSAHPVRRSPAAYLADWRRSLAYNRRVLLDPRLGLPSGLVREVDRVQRRFLQQRGHRIVERLRRGHVVDAHGDLRPEHVWIDDEVRIIDCLEFNDRLRAIDPIDEIAFLSLECERLGSAWAARHLIRRMERLLSGGRSDGLYDFYRCHRATVRARLAIAHLLEPEPRSPKKWPGMARAYLDIARQSARRLERLLDHAAMRRRVPGRDSCCG